MTNMIPRNDLISSQLQAGMTQEGAVELPFPVIYLWTVNGNPQAKAQGGAAYFGGFTSKAEQVDPVIQDNNMNLPTYLHTSTIKKGYVGVGPRRPTLHIKQEVRCDVVPTASCQSIEPVRAGVGEGAAAAQTCAVEHIAKAKDPRVPLPAATNGPGKLLLPALPNH